MAELVVQVSYSRREQFWLAVLAFVGFVGLNGMFVYGMLVQPDAFTSTLSNPVALAFMLEAFILLGVLAYLLRRWGVMRLHWGWFVALSIAGGIAFALPVALLWHNGVQPVASEPGDASGHTGARSV